MYATLVATHIPSQFLARAIISRAANQRRPGTLVAVGLCEPPFADTADGQLIIEIAGTEGRDVHAHPIKRSRADVGAEQCASNWRLVLPPPEPTGPCTNGPSATAVPTARFGARLPHSGRSGYCRI